MKKAILWFSLAAFMVGAGWVGMAGAEDPYRIDDAQRLAAVYFHQVWVSNAADEREALARHPGASFEVYCPIAGARVEMVSRSGVRSIRTTGEDGRCEFEVSATGYYNLTVSKDGYRTSNSRTFVSAPPSHYPGRFASWDIVRLEPLRKWVVKKINIRALPREKFLPQEKLKK